LIGDSACIIGLGLMGGSLARDLAAAGMRVTGYDTNTPSLQAALDSGILSATLEPGLAGALQHDVVVIGTPIRQIPGILRQLSGQSGAAALITDLGSTKTAIVAAAEEVGLGARFVGSHPLTGKEQSGWSSGHPHLFTDALVFLCPSHDTQPDALERARALWKLVGARTRVLDVNEHDARVAWISHLPQVLSSALGIVLRNHGFLPADLGPGGRDMTRLTHSDAQMWLDIVMTNRQALEQPLRETSALLDALREALQQNDEDEVSRFLRTAARFDSGSP
jgi:prephenate dehydrogenase